MRRKDRLTDREAALEIIDASGYAALATTNGDGSPYVIPVSPAREKESIFISIAQEQARSSTTFIVTRGYA